MYENKRIDKVPENYIWWAIDPSSLQKPWYRKMVETTFRYRNHKCPTTLPASVMASTAGPSIGDHSYPQLQDLVRRGEALPAIPPRPYRKRRPPNVQNPVGELVDERDDVRVSVGPDDKYEMDDFVVPDDEEGCRKEISQEEDEEVHDGGSDAHGGVDVSGSQTERLSPSRASADDFQTLESELDSDSGDYESDTPLGQLHVKKMAKRRAGKRKAEDVSSSCPQRTHQSTGESSDNDIAAQLPRKRLKGAD
ncbi:hypothetical protein EDB19DRAFT_977257 [Suillus lakei]|nr:hypothetical protein EDB19DRAFT_977257 [Suillus lakei]